MAHSVDVPLGLDDFDPIRLKIPFIANLKPSGRYVMQDLFEVGGVPAVMKLLLNAGLLHGDCLTVTGKTIAENLKEYPDLSKDQECDSTLFQSNPDYWNTCCFAGEPCPRWWDC